ncbi:hypothetical protein [Pseudanabaena sp. UWO310]|uniref:hypothetical protein n=1 Tax=Pseudanabaena sp. UWO310 TaxID=2480795 RepID=UPI00115804D4|nr:hypothetical protein [Pseudanabaena sp. UWO310]TYQ27926.1 hypothetical protein PseudUWO310_15055 [Pseudanabaena sp. UWO310]
MWRKNKLIGKWQDQKNPNVSLEFLSDGKVIYTKIGKLESWESSSDVKKWEIIEGNRLLIEGGQALKITFEGNTLTLSSEKIQLKYNRIN